MKNNKFFLAVIVGTIVSFLLGGLFYAFLLKDFMSANCGLPADIRDKVFKSMDKPVPVDMIILIVSNFAGALLFTIIAGWANARTFGAGAKVGAIIGFLYCVNMDLLYYAVTYMNTPTLIAVDVLVGTVMSTITVGVIGMILGKGKTTS